MTVKRRRAGRNSSPTCRSGGLLAHGLLKKITGKKRMLVCIPAIAIAVLMSLTAAAAESFTDSGDHWADEAIE